MYATNQPIITVLNLNSGVCKPLSVEPDFSKLVASDLIITECSSPTQRGDKAHTLVGKCWGGESLDKPGRPRAKLRDQLITELEVGQVKYVTDPINGTGKYHGISGAQNSTVTHFFFVEAPKRTTEMKMEQVHVIPCSLVMSAPLERSTVQRGADVQYELSLPRVRKLVEEHPRFCRSYDLREHRPELFTGSLVEF